MSISPSSFFTSWVAKTVSTFGKTSLRYHKYAQVRSVKCYRAGDSGFCNTTRPEINCQLLFCSIFTLYFPFSTNFMLNSVLSLFFFQFHFFFGLFHLLACHPLSSAHCAFALFYLYQLPFTTLYSSYLTCSILQPFGLVNPSFYSIIPSFSSISYIFDTYSNSSMSSMTCLSSTLLLVPFLCRT